MTRIDRSILRFGLAGCALLCAMLARPALAGQIQDYVRLRGLEGDKLIGLGLVVGLDGTGDSMKDSSIAGQPYSALLKRLGNISSTRVDQLKIRSAAIVYVSVDLPAGGMRIGDRLDVSIAAAGNAKSLSGGRLVTTFLVSDVIPDDRNLWVPYAIAEGGPVEAGPLQTVGTIGAGARMVRDLIMDPVADNTIWLVLEQPYAGYPAAEAIASIVNDELALSGHGGAARVEDSKTIRVRIPEPFRDRAAEFISQVLVFNVPSDLLRLPSRVVVDQRNKVMTIGESVEFRPSAITADTLRITTITPPLQPTPDNPMLETQAWAGLATGREARESMRLRDLVESLRQLDVPFETQVAIIKNLKSSGALTAEVIYR